MASSRSPIVVRGARTHNLRNVSLSLPAGRLIVITGVSGSGKSSLAFDTIYAEGQRRYVESLSAYARQFLERMEKPDVDSIEGICPSIAIRQKNAVRNPRSTVGTVTEIHDYLRLLFSRVGTTICRQCGQTVRRETAEAVTSELLTRPEGTRVIIGFDLPLVDLRKAPTDDAREVGEADAAAESAAETPRGPAGSREVEELRRKGFGRVVLDDEVVSLDDLDPRRLKGRTHLGVVVDRIRLDADARSRLTDSVEMAYREGGGIAWVIEPGTAPAAASRTEYSERFECRACHMTYEDPQPRLFSFNNPFGACANCHGFGNVVEVDMELVIPDPSKTISGGAQ